mgnify:CR=1 FL=1
MLGASEAWRCVVDSRGWITEEQFFRDNVVLAVIGVSVNRWVMVLQVMAVPVIILFLGCMSLIEILYHLSLSIKPEDPMSLFGIQFYVQSLVPWLIAVILTIGGLFLFLKTRPVVRKAWQTAASQLKQKDSAS